MTSLPTSTSMPGLSIEFSIVIFFPFCDFMHRQVFFSVQFFDLFYLNVLVTLVGWFDCGGMVVVGIIFELKQK